MKGQKRLKILHLIDSSRHGGAEEILATLVASLGSEKYEHHIILPDAGWLCRELEEVKGISVSLFDGRGKFNLYFLRHLVSMIRINKIDLVHTHLFGTSLYGAIAGSLCRVPVVCTFHGFIDLPQGGLLTKLKLVLVGLLASRIVAVSNSLKAHLARQFTWGLRKLDTIYNGIDLKQKSALSCSEARAKINVADDVVIVGAIGNIKQAKGYDVFLRTAAEFVKIVPNCLFVVAGREDSKIIGTLATLSKELGLESRVRFVGYQDKIYDFLQALDVLLLTSESEGFSLVIVEAMNAYVPVVATRCGGPQEIVTHNVDGFLAEVGDEKGLAKGLQSVLQDGRHREVFVANALRTVRDRFSEQTMLICYENLYADLCCRK